MAFRQVFLSTSVLLFVAVANAGSNGGNYGPPINCAAVQCPSFLSCPDDSELFTPDGSCCPQCRTIFRPPIDCSIVRCARPECPPGQKPVNIPEHCCPVCRPIDCSLIDCIWPVPVCPPGEKLVNVPESCCPVCRPTVQLGKSCFHNGREYKDGSTFMIDYTECRCLNGEADCTRKAYPAGCTYKGRQYSHGDTFPDSCNTCACNFGSVSCTEMACEGSNDGSYGPPANCADVLCPVPLCLDGFELFTPDGSCCPQCRPIIRPPIDCSAVRCSRVECPPGQEPVNIPEKCCPVCRPIDCSLVDCIWPEPVCPPGEKLVNVPEECCPVCRPTGGNSCYYNGKTYKDGSSFMIDCNECRCLNGVAACTKKACPVGCTYKGRQYSHGDTFPDLCNTCTCYNGGVSCTEIACEERPGQCPKPIPFCGKTDMCNWDGDCPSKQKCCADVCGRMTCRMPIFVNNTVCVHNGIKYNEGDEIFPNVKDPCTICFCESGSFRCEQLFCVACVGVIRPGQCCPDCSVQTLPPPSYK